MDTFTNVLKWEPVRRGKVPVNNLLHHIFCVEGVKRVTTKLFFNNS